MINVKFSEFKKYVLEDADRIFSKKGFKFNKGKQSFKKGVGKNYIQYSFDFLTYFPDWYEYTFGFSISINEIEKLKNELNESAKIDKGLAYSCFFYQGDFIEEVKRSERKYRSGYYSKVLSLDDLKISVDRTLDIIEREALPLSYSLCNLEAFQDYYLVNKNEIVRNFGSEPLFVSTLLAAYLKSITEYYDLSRFLKSELDMEKSKGSDYKQLNVLLDKIDQFINYKVGSNIA